MKKIFFGSMAVLIWASAIQGAIVTPFGVNYAVSNYTASSSVGSVPNTASGIWLGNLRGLGTWKDLAIANSADNTVSVRRSNNDGTYGSLASYAVGPGPAGIRCANLNGDAFEDIVVANSGTNTISVLYNNGGGLSFSGASNFVVGATANPGPIDVAVSDIDGNGSQDMVVANSSENSVSVLLRSGTDYVLSTNYSVGNNPHSILIIDFNKDGRRDLLVPNRNDGTLTILYKQTNGTFASPQTITLFPGGDPQPVHALVADFNGDTWYDIACANYNSNSVSILLGTTNGTFTLSTNCSVGINPRSIAIRDFNNDTLWDIAVANEGDGAVEVLLNSAGAVFQGGYTSAVGSSPVAIAGSHLDVGPVEDIAVANNGDNTVSILLYNLPLVYSNLVTAIEDATNSITLTSLVSPGTTPAYTVLSSPAFGTLTGTAPNLTYVPTNHFYGTDSFTYRVNDGTTDSETGTITINVLPVNDPPSFTLNVTSVTLQKYGVLNTYSNIVASVDKGPNESSQTHSFIVTTTNTSMFSTQPALSAAGVLTFRPSASANGTATLSIRIRDNGGTLRGGIDQSPVQTFTVNLPANPYAPISGNYNGLFYETNGVTHESSGYAMFTVSSSGSLSGRLTLQRNYSFTGNFNPSGLATVIVSRGTNGPPLTMNLAIDLVPGGTEQITGTVTDGTWTADLLADRSVFNSVTNPAPQAGKYTMLMPGSNDPANSPGGYGYASVSVTTAGVISASGVLADGKTFTQSSKLSKNGTWPLYVPVYSTKGSLLSWITFTNETTTSLKGDFSWIKTGAAGGSPYPLGFTNELLSIGSTYTAPPVGTRILNLTNGITRLDNGGNLPGPVINTVVLKTNNTLTISASQVSGMTLTINTNLGYVTGKGSHPISGLYMPVKGIVFQQQNIARGYFLGTNESGAFLLQQN